MEVKATRKPRKKASASISGGPAESAPCLSSGGDGPPPPARATEPLLDDPDDYLWKIPELAKRLRFSPQWIRKKIIFLPDGTLRPGIQPYPRGENGAKKDYRIPDSVLAQWCVENKLDPAKVCKRYPR